LIQCVLERTQISDYVDAVGIWNPDLSFIIIDFLQLFFWGIGNNFWYYLYFD